MKRRLSFVTNSSSSSFIIGFDKKPESPEEMKMVLFGEQQQFLDPYHNDTYFSDRPESYDALEVARIVFRDIENQQPLSGEAIESFITQDSWGYEPEDISKELSQFEGKQVFEVEYADDEGYLSCAMEHGDLFKNIPYASQSNH